MLDPVTAVSSRTSSVASHQAHTQLPTNTASSFLFIHSVFLSPPLPTYTTFPSTSLTMLNSPTYSITKQQIFSQPLHSQIRFHTFQYFLFTASDQLPAFFLYPASTISSVIVVFYSVRHYQGLNCKFSGNICYNEKSNGNHSNRESVNVQAKTTFRKNSWRSDATSQQVSQNTRNTSSRVIQIPSVPVSVVCQIVSSATFLCIKGITALSLPATSSFFVVDRLPLK